MKPFISVLLPTHARYAGGFLEKAVESVLLQSYSNFELLVVDDASVDGTAEYLQKLSHKDSRIKHIRFEQNVGLPALTLFKAYLQSKGEFIAFNFDDNVLRPNALAKLEEKLTNQPEFGMAYGETVIHMPERDITYGKEPNIEDLRKFNYIGNSSVMLRRGTIEKIGWYDPHILLKRSCDWDLWLRIFEAIPVGFVPEVLSEEYGQELPDSFRRAYYSFDDLMHRYMATNRNSTLLPAALMSGNRSVTEVPFQLSQKEQKELALACLEHFVRALDFQAIAHHSSQLLREGDKDINRLWRRIQHRKGATYSEEALLTMLGTTYYYSQKLELTQKSLHTQEAVLHDVANELGSYKDQYHELLRSLSWRLTKPLRETMVLLSGQSKGV